LGKGIRMDIVISQTIMEALVRYKTEKRLSSNRALAKSLEISPSMISQWFSKPGMTIRHKVWDRVGPALEPYIKDAIIGNDRTIAELEKWKDEEDTDFIIASLCFELGELKDIIPESLQKLSGKKREALIKMIENLSVILE